MQQEDLNEDNVGRTLNESQNFMLDLSLDEETQKLREFYEEIEIESKKDSESIRINSIQNSDLSLTTGNNDSVKDFDLLLPLEELSFQDKE